MAAGTAPAIRWALIGTTSVMFLQILKLVLVARYVEPDALGVFAILLLGLSLAETVAQLGFVEAIIARPETDRELRASLFWLSVAVSLFFCVALWFSSGGIERVTNVPLLSDSIRLMALTLAVGPASAQVRGMFRKRLELRPPTLIDIVAASLGLFTTLVMARQGQGLLALAGGHLVQAGLSALVLIVLGVLRGWVHWPQIVVSRLASWLRFGVRVVAAAIVNLVNSRVDLVAVAALLGPTALGYYSLSLNLVIYPVARLSPMLAQVGFPVLASYPAGSRRMSDGYRQQIGIVGALMGPILIGLLVVSADAVPLLLGEAWLACVPIVQVLAIYALLRSISNVGGSLLMASQAPGLALKWNLLLLFLIPPTVVLGAVLAGLWGVGLALVAMQVLLLLVWHRMILVPLVAVDLSTFLRTVAAALLPAFIMGAIVAAADFLLFIENSGLRLFLLSSLGLCSYSLLLPWMRPGIFHQAIHIARMRSRDSN